MATGYNREFLISAMLHKYMCLPEDKFAWMCDFITDYYDKVSSRDEFRKYCALDAQAIKDYKDFCESQCKPN